MASPALVSPTGSRTGAGSSIQGSRSPALHPLQQAAAQTSQPNDGPPGVRAASTPDVGQHVPLQAISPRWESTLSEGNHDAESLNSPPLNVPLLKPIFRPSERVIDGSDNRRRSSAASAVTPHVYWRPVVAMVLSLIVGVGAAAALYGYYTSLDSTPVGSTDDQQRALRVGTALAFFAQVGLVYSIHKAYVQWLWRELKSHTISFTAIDAAFATTSDPLAFTNIEMLKRVKMASLIALVGWLIPISSFIAPATLNINQVMHETTYQMSIPTLDISQASAYESFTYAVNGTTATEQKYLGPRTIITRFAVAAATTGEIMTLPQPATNASYELAFYGPYVQCANSTTEVQDQMDGMIERFNQSLGSTIELKALDYFAAIPALSNDNNATVQIANLTDIDDVAYGSNQLWLYFTSYVPSLDFSQPTTSHYLTCDLYNASYTTRFTWENGIQNLELLNRTLIDTVPYPANASTAAASEDAMSYSAVMWALSTQLTGSMAFYRDLAAEDATLAGHVYSDIATDLAQTVLIGSSDFDSHFIENHLLGLAANATDDSNATTYSDQRLLDMYYAHNNTLSVLISELSSNITLSLFGDPLLAPQAPANVTVASPRNIYSFQSRNVLLAYCLAAAVAIIANILGFYAFYASGESHDVSFSSIACSTHDIHFSRLRAHERLGVLPLDPVIARTRLEFHAGGDGRWGFGALEDEEGVKAHA